jgi:hypothetical protein
MPVTLAKMPGAVYTTKVSLSCTPSNDSGANAVTQNNGLRHLRIPVDRPFPVNFDLLYQAMVQASYLAGCGMYLTFTFSMVPLNLNGAFSR